MKTSRESKNTISPLHTYQPLPLTTLNRAFAVVYTCATLALFYHHILTLIYSTTLLSIFLHLSLLVSDAILTFMWATTQAFRMRPIKRKEYLENLPSIVDYKDYPSLDVFICTADPYKEPPINVINTALSVMAYDYPSDKVSVYVSDDGGSMLTLFAFMEAAKFATHWLPFCRANNIVDRCPAAYFQSTHAHIRSSKTEEIKMMYESMKMKVESVVDRGSIEDEFITGEKDSEAFKKWTTEFTRNDHPTIIQVLLESAKVKDITGHRMPNLVYISREKNKTSPHHFKAGALNVLLRVSATMTNAPMVLTQDCDMYSNDPQTPLRALCYILDPTKASSDLAYIQFPQRFHGINKNDIYASELKRLFQINPRGMDGLAGPNYVGSGCFFLRRALFGGPLSALSPEIPELNPNHVVDKSIQSEAVMELAHNVASCKFEDQTNWGSKMGFRYGSLVEDYFSGYRLLCEGWKSVFCDPDRPAFLGDVPITLNDSLSQTRRWCVGLLEVTYSKYCPITFGVRSMGLFMGLAFAHYAFWPIYSVPITIYGILPPLALINGVSVFPKVSSPWFYVHMFLFLGAYGQDFLDYIIGGGTFRQWYSDQRMWMIRSVSCYLFGFIDYVLKSLGISAFGFNVTSKVIDDEESKRYEQGLFEFGVASPLFVPITTIALINLVAFIVGLDEIFGHGKPENILVQINHVRVCMVNCRQFMRP
ncbi:hypothetical protein IFM89_024851 [Coptis chinensis]|uniref:Cellulose synthase-like protein G3 n=1 Tax=Coptis chinensis TaxID=261450 RepID=A0A835HMB1_9MAGN|nr:hypothetical protein IFM89_024851 [Coptis chinensis]